MLSEEMANRYQRRWPLLVVADSTLDQFQMFVGTEIKITGCFCKIQ